MSARRALALAALALGAGIAAVVVAVAHRPAQSTVRLTGGPIGTRRSLTPAEPQFGDPVAATIEVFVDPRRVDPRSVKLDARFAPFTVVSSTRSIRRTGDVSVIRVVDRLDCLDRRCLPKSAAATFRFPRLRVAYPGGTLVAAWPALRVHARVPATDLRHPMLRVGPPLARSSYRFPPGLTGWALLVAGLACALGGLALLARAALPGTPLARRRRGTPLERILDELTAGTNGRSRATLEQLARELEPVDEPLSFESRVLAWAPQEPEPEAVADLAERVRAVVGR